MVRVFRRGGGRQPDAGGDAFPPPRPGTRVVAVGDVHGCAAKLDTLLGQVGGGHLVLLGDVIDRGPDSRAVLSRVAGLQREDPDGVTVLLGNHEDMALRFLEDPEAQGPVWLRNGGLQTLASFGVRGLGETAPGPELNRAAAELRDAMGPEMEAWLRARPLQARFGNVHVAHAGADPSRDMDMQDDETLLWGHRDFRTAARADGQWVVHGHYIVEAPHVVAGRVAVDTGAYATGRLSAAVIEDDEVSFITV